MTPGRRFACHLMDAAAGAMGIARGDALFALAALLWHRHQLSWPLAMHLSMLCHDAHACLIGCVVGVLADVW